MRTKNSVYNIIANLLIILLQTILIFVVRIFFVKNLNVEYLGLQGLFNNIITMLSLADMGISVSICFSLYEPLAKRDYNKVSTIMSFFRKIYWIISGIILLIGIVMMPFIYLLTTGYTMGHLKLIFSVYAFMIATEYFLNYKEVLILADQKKYKLATINIIFTFLIYISQIVVLIIFKNFIFYILSELIFKTIKIGISNIYVTRYYPQVNFYSKEKMDKKIKHKLKKNVKGMFVFKIGDYLVNGTDNIIISKCINIGAVGIYGNYLSVISICRHITNEIINGITSSFGNLIVEENEKTQENVFNIMDYINFIIVGYFFVCIFQLFNKFIMICFGSDYLLNFRDVIIICINFYVISILLPINSVKSAAGLYYEDRHISLIQAVINLILSLVLVQYIGLTGVLLGTTFSYLLLVTWQRPYIVYKKIFNSSFLKYLFNQLKRIILILFIVIINYLIFSWKTIPNTIIGFFINGSICTLIYVIIMLIYSYNKKEFKYIIDMLKNKIKQHVENPKRY